MSRYDAKKIEFEEVESFTYLGVVIDNKWLERKEIEMRIAKANNCSRSLTRILNNREISKKIIRVYNSILRPTLTYASET